MHFCAKSLVGESMANPDLYYRNNVIGTINLLGAMAKYDVRHFIFSSSAAVYGTPIHSPIDETHPTSPINPYGRTKLMVETLLPDFESAYGIRSVSLRYFNAAGADEDAVIGEMHDPETHLIPNALQSVLDGSAQSLKVFGDDYETPDGTCIRDYVHVTDLSEAHIAALNYLVDGGKSDIFNLGNGNGFSVREVIECVRKVTMREVSYSIGERRPGDPPTLVASSEKARRVLGWTPRYAALEDIVATAWKWHKRQAANKSSDAPCDGSSSEERR
jgi:UDP-glucose 4-epimerase